MYDGYASTPLGESCPHGCQHRAQSYCGTGQTVAQDRLVECDHCGCRGWLDRRRYEDPVFWRNSIDFRTATGDA